MNALAHPFMRAALIGLLVLVVVAAAFALSQVIITATAAVPGAPELITNAQYAALRGGQDLLLLGEKVNYLYLPLARR